MADIAIGVRTCVYGGDYASRQFRQHIAPAISMQYGVTILILLMLPVTLCALAHGSRT